MSKVDFRTPVRYVDMALPCKSGAQHKESADTVSLILIVVELKGTRVSLERWTGFNHVRFA
jgi:hypothetical protein